MEFEYQQIDQLLPRDEARPERPRFIGNEEKWERKQKKTDRLGGRGLELY